MELPIQSRAKVCRGLAFGLAFAIAWGLMLWIPLGQAGAQEPSKVVKSNEVLKQPVEKASPSTQPPSAKQVSKLGTNDEAAASKTSIAKTPASSRVKQDDPKPPQPVDRTHIFNNLTFDDLKFEMEKGGDFKRSMLTDKINGYHGTTVQLRGYIRPNSKQSGLTRFIFVRDNQECCFGEKAAIFDNVLVKLAKGKETDFTVRPVTVKGKFALKEYVGSNGKVWSLYRMYQAEVK